MINIPERLKKLLIEIHKITGFKKFILYGGLPLDIILNKDTKSRDLDIAVNWVNKNKIKKFIERIKKKGFEIIEPFREYYIYKNQKVILVYARNKNWFLDVAFLKNPTLIGQFNIESLYCRYPQLDCMDKFRALDGIKKKKIKLIRGLKKENPHLLLGRFLRLCAKYDIPLNSKDSKKILLNLKDEVKKWKIKNDFHKSAYASCLSSLLKSILIVTNKKAFLKILLKEKIFEIIFPELVHSNSYSTILIKNVSNLKTKSDIIILLYNCLDKERRESFRDRIMLLKLRKWNEDDIRCAYSIPKL
jgi:hypothetical protein